MPVRVIEEAIEKVSGVALTPEEREKIKIYHPICKLRVLVDAIKRGVTTKGDLIREIESKCAGKEHGIARLSAELKRLVAGR